MSRDPLAEWQISEYSYPADGSASEKLRFLLGYAILAPSGHNPQPWLFRLEAIVSTCGLTGPGVCRSSAPRIGR